MVFNDIIYQFESWGVFDILLPFLFIFTLIFGLLEKTKILGKERTSINAIISIILGLFFITQFEIVQTMTNFLPKISLFVIIAVMFLLMITFFGAKFHEGPSSPTMWLIYIVAIVAIYWALSPSLGLELPYWAYGDWTPWIIVIGLILFIWFMIKGEDNQSQSRPDPLRRRE